MKRSASVVIGGVLALLVSGCTSASEEPVESDFTEVCVDEQQQVYPEDQCDDEGDHAHGRGFIYVPRGTYIPAHGSKITGTYTNVRPASGSIGRAPSSGGFGTHAGTVS